MIRWPGGPRRGLPVRGRDAIWLAVAGAAGWLGVLLAALADAAPVAP